MSSVDVCHDSPRPQTSAAAIFVLGVWLVMFAGAIGLLVRFAVNVPYAEDGMLIPYVTGNENLNLNFLCSVYSSHIIPVPKFVLYLLARFTHDFRSSMYLSVTMCAIVALALAFTARSLRGRFDYSDAFFALGLLHLGHWESFLLGFAIQEVMSTTLLVIVLIVILRSGASLTRGQSLLIGLCLVVLPTTGTAGFLLVPPLACWLAYSAWISWRVDAPGASANAVLQLVLVLIALIFLTPYYFSVPHGMPWLHGQATVGAKFRAFRGVLLQVISLGFGSGAASSWLPFLNQDRSVRLVGYVVLFLAALGLGFLFVRRHPPEERLRKAGLFSYLSATFLVLAGIAFGRSGASMTIGLSPRYSLYSVPFLWGIFFLWQLYGSHLGKRLIPVGLFAFMCAMSSLNMQLGYVSGEARHAMLKPMERDLTLSEIPACDIASTYNRHVSGAHWVCYKLAGRGDNEQIIIANMADMVNMLRQSGIPRQPVASHP